MLMRNTVQVIPNTEIPSRHNLTIWTRWFFFLSNTDRGCQHLWLQYYLIHGKLVDLVGNSFQCGNCSTCTKGCNTYFLLVRKAGVKMRLLHRPEDGTLSTTATLFMTVFFFLSGIVMHFNCYGMEVFFFPCFIDDVSRKDEKAYI